ncbi:BaiN/RdsA family NAD(P)/FAD-dependent oxidoreductase [Tautonia marina]|uniref:NAD(P)/FAD-dependent oxidoreductase n=1 Tax=Tautonia marina TaxID=2653855 RepID=UPI0012610106|nr:NAD(P)/FAD-dependent oxidoreductase [Tautonia marina]
MTAVDYDVAVLGAGAAGLFAAVRAAERGRRVVVVEKNRRPGVKILMSGGTRCNITNARGLKDRSVVSGPIDPAFNPKEARGSRSIMEAFGPNGRFLGPALKALSVEQTVRLFEAEGVATKIEGNGKVFPVSDKAVDVLDALARRLDRSGAELRTLCPVSAVEALDDAFLVHLPDGALRARRVILSVGGQSYPGCGTTGDGYAIARSFGHTIVPPKPALVPLRIEADWVRELKGITVPDAVARVLVPRGPKLADRREAVLFAHFGLTGPAILDVSGPVARFDGPAPLMLELDFVPDTRLEVLDAQLQASARSGRRLVSNLLPEELPRRLTTALMRACAVPEDRVGPELSRDERRRLLAGFKSLRLPIAGTLGFAKAEVTSGGVALDEVDPATLESRLQPGFHLIGEVLDLDGRIGGYNFQAAWSSGWLAGDSV